MIWYIRGVERESGLDRRVFVQASDEDEAYRQASTRGVVACSARKVGQPRHFAIGAIVVFALLIPVFNTCKNHQVAPYEDTFVVQPADENHIGVSSTDFLGQFFERDRSRQPTDTINGQPRWTLYDPNSKLAVTVSGPPENIMSATVWSTYSSENYPLFAFKIILWDFTNYKAAGYIDLEAWFYKCIERAQDEPYHSDSIIADGRRFYFRGQGGAYEWPELYADDVPHFELRIVPSP